MAAGELAALSKKGSVGGRKNKCQKSCSRGHKRQKPYNRDDKRQNGAPNKRSTIHAEVKDLEARIRLECSDDFNLSSERVDDTHVAKQSEGPDLTLSLFSELPLSGRTKRGLKACDFECLTPIQRKAIPYALAGYDVLGEAETGSGKTLAFIVPLLENLYRKLWDKQEGLGALVIIPTRELAAQIFDVLKDVGRFHDFSAICLIGGKDIDQETGRVGDMNIVIATPGRLLQHLDESPLLDPSNLVMLVIDEADLLLDMGFADTMKNIVDQLPSSEFRQTLLFSATLSAGVHRLALLSLKENSKRVTARSSMDRVVPADDRLKQFFIVTPLQDQIQLLFALLRGRSQKRMIVFVNSCKQVRFIFEAFCRLKPGCGLFELHGRQHQQKRLDTLQQFSVKKAAACLICTDVAARGIDFPSVDLVIQLNCPPDVATYIHRVGRTARYRSSGNSVLCLLPSETAFLERLAEQQIKPIQMYMRPKKILPLSGKLASLLAANPAIKYLAQRSYISYLRSLRLFKDKKVFNYDAAVGGSEGAQRFAESLGLVSIPESAQVELTVAEKKTKMTKLERLKQKIQLKKQSLTEKQEDWVSSDDEKSCTVSVKSKTQRRLERLRRLRQEKTEDLIESEKPVEGSLFAVETPADTNDDNSVAPPSVLDSAFVKRKLRKQQIHIRADGTAKIKGLAMLSSDRFQRPDHHVFFDEEEVAENPTQSSSVPLKKKSPFEHLVEELNKTNADVTQKMTFNDTRQQYLETVRQELEKSKGSDKARERERIHLRHVKRRVTRREVPPDALDCPVVLGPSASDEEDDPQTKRARVDQSVSNLEEAALSVLKF